MVRIGPQWERVHYEDFTLNDEVVSIRALGSDDAAEYQALRLRGMIESPAAFGSTHAEDQALPLTTVAERLTPRGSGPERIVLGSYLAKRGETPALVGIVGCMREAKVKTRHKATVWGMYVSPEARRRGIARALLDAMIIAVRTWPGVERLVLTVIESEAAARGLYRDVGFVPFGMEPDAFREHGESQVAEHMSLRVS